MVQDERSSPVPEVADTDEQRSQPRDPGSALKFRVVVTFLGSAVYLVAELLQRSADTQLEELSNAWAQVLGVLIAVGGGFWVVFDLLSQRERERAKRVLDGGRTYRVSGDGASIRLYANGEERNAAPDSSSVPDRFAVRQERMLEDSYVQGISQARLIFWVSIVFLCLGALILLGGATSAVLSGGSKGKVEAGIVAAVAGTVSSLLSGTFLYQANRSRDSVIEQAARMQARSMADRRIAVVREVAESIEGIEEQNKAKQDLLRTLIDSLDKLDDRQIADLQPPGRRRASTRRGRDRAQADQHDGAGLPER